MRSPLERLDGRSLDVLVLGGGISGAATARTLAWRGFDVALIEPHDFAWGTSGRSSRLIHGGLRYLAGGHLKLVRESLRARLELVHAAPHLVRPCPFVLPLGDTYTRRWPLVARLGLAVYDLLSRPRRGWPAPQQITPEEARVLLPGFAPGRFRRALLYHDGWTDDRRLTLLTALDARRGGAQIANRCELVAVDADASGSARATARDRLTGDMARFSCRAIVNATGPWVDRVRERLGGATPRAREASLVRPTRGAHLAVAGRIDGAALLLHPRDGRVVFLVPGQGSFIAGTTDEDDLRPPDEISATEEDSSYLHELLDHAFPETNLRVRAAFAGLRPLVNQRGDPDRLSRKSRLIEEDVLGVPMFSIVGGKLTLHRPMAEKAADRIERRLGSPDVPRVSPEPRLPGGDVSSIPGEEAAARAFGLTSLQARWMIARYGSTWREIIESSDAGLATLGTDEIPLIAEVYWAHREEALRTLSDLLLRWRLPESVDDELAVSERTADVLAAHAGWSSARADRERERWRKDRELVYGALDQTLLETP